LCGSALVPAVVREELDEAHKCLKPRSMPQEDGFIRVCLRKSKKNATRQTLQ
jgi:hypothetical protein